MLLSVCQYKCPEHCVLNVMWPDRVQSLSGNARIPRANVKCTAKHVFKVWLWNRTAGEFVAEESIQHLFSNNPWAILLVEVAVFIKSGYRMSKKWELAVFSLATECQQNEVRAAVLAIFCRNITGIFRLKVGCIFRLEVGYNPVLPTSSILSQISKALVGLASWCALSCEVAPLFPCVYMSG